MMEHQKRWDIGSAFEVEGAKGALGLALRDAGTGLPAMEVVLVGGGARTGVGEGAGRYAYGPVEPGQGAAPVAHTPATGVAKAVRA